MFRKQEDLCGTAPFITTELLRKSRAATDSIYELIGEKKGVKNEALFCALATSLAEILAIQMYTIDPDMEIEEAEKFSIRVTDRMILLAIEGYMNVKEWINDEP